MQASGYNVGSITVPEGGLRLSSYDPDKWWIVVAPGITFGAKTRPNPWVRFWHRVLLGWKWEAIK